MLGIANPADRQGRGSDTAPPAFLHRDERSRRPEETVALLRPRFFELGITRLCRQTDLDQVGIPCFAAIRPNSRSLASHQGKGLDDASAQASAVMEAAEYAIAEQPDVPVETASIADLDRLGMQYILPRSQMPIGYEFDPNQPLSWITGIDLLHGTPVRLSLEALSLSGIATELPGLCQHTNGLASGNTPEEALFHGLCELVERDANTLWSLLSDRARADRRIFPEGSAALSFLTEKIERADLQMLLFDQMTDISIPTVMAIVAPRTRENKGLLELAAGYGCHPNAERAVVRALTEALQSRVTSIAGSRDDIRAESFAALAEAEHWRHLESSETARSEGPQSLCDAGTPLKRLIDVMLDRLRSAGIQNLVAASLGGEKFGISVMRVLSPDLEDRGVNLNWRPGRRALNLMLESL